MPSAFGAANLIVLEIDGGSGSTYTIRERTTAGTLVQTVSTPGAINRVSLARDTAGNLYVTEYFTGAGPFNRVRKFTADGADTGILIDLTALVGAFESYLVGLDRDGNIYVGNLSSTALHKFTAAGAFVQTYTIPVVDFVRQEGACVSPDGERYYYTDFNLTTGAAEVRLYNLVTSTAGSIVYSVPAPIPFTGSEITIRVHQSGDLLIYSGDAGGANEKLTLARVTSVGAVVGEWVVHGPAAYSAAVAMAVLVGSSHAAYLGAQGQLAHKILTVDTGTGTAATAYSINTVDIHDIAHVFDVAPAVARRSWVGFIGGWIAAIGAAWLACGRG